MNADTYIKEYERATGKKAGNAVRRFAEGLLSIEAKFEAKGREDRAQGLQVPGMDAFTHWADRVFDDDAELAATVADLMRMAYLDGYNAGEVVS